MQVICPSGSRAGILSSPLRKNISLPFFGKSCFLSAFRLDEVGRTRRHDREAGCDGREGIVRRAMRERTAKACRPGAQVAGVKLAGRRLASDGDKQAKSLRGEHAIDR